MSRLFYHVMQDNLGNLLFDVTGTFRLSGTGTLATIYGDAALTVILPNPMTNHPSFGSFTCFLPAGLYDFYMAKPGYTFETLAQVQGWGTMAMQDASAVVITGGDAVLTSVQGLHIGAGRAPDVAFAIAVATWPAFFATNVQMAARAGLGTAWLGNAQLAIQYVKNSDYGISIRPNDLDTGGGQAMIFLNVAGGPVGSINTNATSTSFNVSSDARLKEAVEPLTGALDIVRALNPVSFAWKADGSPGRGLLAQEVAAVIPAGVITGEKDAVDDEGQVVPQMIDYSKLVPYLIGAVKELTQQVEMLTAKLAGAGAHGDG